MPFTPFSTLLQLIAATAQAGIALINGTQTFLIVQVPNDGQMHLVQAIVSLNVTVAETGGQVTLNWTAPAGGAASFAILGGGQGAGVAAASQARLVAPGTAVTLTQSTALTAGASVLTAEIWVA